MLTKLLIAILLLGTVFANPPSQASSLFSSTAGQFNTLVEGNFECHASETLGRLGAGGNVNITSYAVACGLLNPGTTTCIGATSLQCGQLGQATQCDTSSGVCEYGLVSGNSLSASNGAVRLGSAAYVNSITIDQTFSIQCPPKKITIVNFSSEFSQLRSISNRLAQLQATGQTSLQFGTILQLSGQGSNQVQIFSASCSQLASATTIRLTNVQSTTTVIVNFSGASCSITNIGFEGFNPSNTIFNFASASSLNLNGIGMTGTLLAPNANINEALNGNIQGHVFVKSWVATRNGCIEQQWFPFRGQNPLMG